MALRALAKHTALLRTAGSSQCRHWSSPTVFDKMVQLTVVDRDGRRHPLCGLVGQTLADVLRDNEEVVGEENICLSPEGRNEYEAHVLVPNEFLQRIPLSTDLDRKHLEEITPDILPNSRLGSKVVLTKDFNNMLVALGSLYPWKTL